tara:strand:+ start:199 stop:2850 length:2652 start_codon:yes stop_codon:yes gene_type:complete
MNNNKSYKLILFFFFIIFCLNANSSEQFNFEATEVEILENGNLFKGLKRGIITTNDGFVIEANNFVYNKITNIVNAEGEVKAEDRLNKNTIFADKLIYKKNEEIIIAEGNSKAFDKKGKIIAAKKFTYNKILNILNAEGNAQIEDNNEDYTVNSEHITYFINDQKIVTKGETKSKIQSKYNIKSKDVLYLEKEKKFSSKNKTIIEDDNDQIYYLDEFVYFIDKALLKGKNILTITNFNLPKSDKFFFSEGIFNLQNKNFLAKDTKINIHRDIFGVSDNEPRIYGASSEGDKNLTKIKKGSFTSCQKRNGCPAWSVKSEIIEHDREKKQISYKNAFLNIFDIPVFYFPKFFHPDPSVKRQSGLLRPENNNSDVLGSSLSIPYFKIISETQDYTFTPTWFDNDILSFQNEYRQSNENSQFLADFGLVKGYQSTTTKERSSLSHFFINYDLDLKLDNFDTSKLFISTEQVSNDTYLRVFDAYITKSKARPGSLSLLNNQIKLSLTSENSDFTSGFHAYEDLNIDNSSDKYQYVLPYYSYNTIIEQNYFDGTLSFSSYGSNNLNETNNLSSDLINDVNYYENNITRYGFNNNLNINLKNLNTLGKKSTNYKSSPETELLSLFEINSSLPLVKESQNYTNYLTPKISFRFNPSDMKDNSGLGRTISYNNIFSLNRLGLRDTFESGRSLTIGVNYKREKENLEEINKFFELNLGTVLRDKEENLIPKSSTINRKQSNLFGSINNKFNDNIEIDYYFAIDNNLTTFESNYISTTFSNNYLENTFTFREDNGEMGDASAFSNSLSYKISDNNLITFKTRRNRKINLTEYYDLVYEYKNDCLTAGFKYKKSYYEDRDIKPTENLLFTITIFPLTTYEYNADDFMESDFWQNK